MGGGTAKPGGCERCGRTDDVSYVGWAYYCKTCRLEMERERTQHALRQQAIARLEAEAAAKDKRT